MFDLDARLLTVTLPDASKHVTPTACSAHGTYTLSRERVGARRVCLAIRTCVDPNDNADMKAVHAPQDAVKVEQQAAGAFEPPERDQPLLKGIRDAPLALGAANGRFDTMRMFGRKDEVDPLIRLIGTAGGWTGLPGSESIYVGFLPQQNNGVTVHRLTVKDVPVDGCTLALPG